MDGVKKFTFPILIIYIWTFLEMFCVIPETMKNFDNTLGTIIPYFTITLKLKYFIKIFLVIVIICYILLTKKCKIKIDKMVLFLLLRILLSIVQIPLLRLTNYPASLTNYLLPLIELLLYVAILQIDDMKFCMQMITYANFLALLVAVQVYLQAIFRVLPIVSFSNVYYKACMIIPVGGSNFLSVLMLPALTALLFKKNRSCTENAFIITLIGSIILTKSRYAIFLLFIIFLYYLFCVNNNNRYSIFYKLIMIILVGIVITYVINNKFDNLVSVLHGYSDYVSSGGVLNKISSGRLGSFQYYFQRILNHLILGNGPNYLDSRAHNLIIDILYQNGLPGLLLFIIILIEIHNNIKFKNLKYNYFRIIVIVMLIQSMGEISFFTAEIADILFFCSLAILNNSVSRKKGCI